MCICLKLNLFMDIKEDQNQALLLHGHQGRRVSRSFASSWTSMGDRWGSSSSASSWTWMEGRWGSSSSAYSWTSMEYRWGSSSSLPAHGLKWRQIKSGSFALIFMDINWRWFRIKPLCPNSSCTSMKIKLVCPLQAPLPPHGHQGRQVNIKLVCLFMKSVKMDQHQAPLPVHGHQWRSGWTWNLEKLPWMGSSWRKKRKKLPWHGNLMKSAFKVWFSQLQQHLLSFWAGNRHDSLRGFELLFRLPRRFPSIGETDPDTRRSRVFRVSWGPRLQSPRLFCMYIMVHANSLAVLQFSRSASPLV